MGIAAGVGVKRGSGVAVSRRLNAPPSNPFIWGRFRAENELKFSVLA
jgi:hypothetical protein